MANENCLAGMRCPKCRSEEPFAIQVTVWCESVTDEGTDGDFTDIEWDDDAMCKCVDCGHIATVADFKGEKTEEGATLPAGVYSAFVLSDDGTWQQPIFRTGRNATEREIESALMRNKHEFIVFGLQADDDAPGEYIANDLKL